MPNKESEKNPFTPTTIATLSGSAGTLKKPLSWKKMLQIAREDRIKAR